MASSISNAAYETHTLHHDQPLDIYSLKHLPESYTWQEFGKFPMKDWTASETMPIIDLDDPKAMELIGNACKTWGIFQLTNHGIPKKLLDDIEKSSREIFALPLEQKLKVSKLPNGGIAGYGRPAIDSTYTQRTWSEGFTVAGSPIKYFPQLWPEDYIKYCDLYEEFEKRMRELAAKILWLCLGALGISKSDINWAGQNGQFETAESAIHLNSYPSCPDPDRTVGLPPDTDSSIFTILHQKTVGLKILRNETEWLWVPVIPGALVVNVGDFLHILSNGLYPSVIHQAVVNRTQHRLTMAFFYGAPPKFTLSPVSKLVGPGETPLYRSTTWQEYLKIKAEGNFTALSKIRSSAPLNESE
ncbi:hypothetical protein FNV43_RR25194 [Rhamnella rubrinervis]|uniref:gibberellin 3beta-dioxygenase n=1 Tax=Rhamnella rubrinervis TaxID=2594499 RepID=A0A8K0DP84_9ROSA|nr:hypothetical protein FNV43_RR25194 [Rhamnella rubrinervis]